MKIKGAGSGPQTPPVDETRTEKPDRAGAPSFAGKVDRLSQGSQTAAPTTPRVWGPGPSDELRAVTSELRAGKIDAVQAAQRIIDDVVTRRIGGGLPAAMQQELRNLLTELTSRDPALAANIARLGKRR